MANEAVGAVSNRGNVVDSGALKSAETPGGQAAARLKHLKSLPAVMEAARIVFRDEELSRFVAARPQMVDAALDAIASLAPGGWSARSSPATMARSGSPVEQLVAQLRKPGATADEKEAAMLEVRAMLLKDGNITDDEIIAFAQAFRPN